MKKISSIFLLISLLISACGSKELKKDEAKKIISEYYQLPFQTKIAIDASYEDYGWPPEKYKKLASQGLITIQKGWEGNFIHPAEFKAIVTESGRKYWLQNGTMKTMDEKIRLLVFKGYLIEIKDLSVSSNAKENKAEVQVVLKKSDVSPIQDLFDPLKEFEMNKSIYFKLFDDGWKIVEDNNSKQLFDPIVVPLHWAGGGQITFDAPPAITKTAEKTPANENDYKKFIGEWVTTDEDLGTAEFIITYENGEMKVDAGPGQIEPPPPIYFAKLISSSELRIDRGNDDYYKNCVFELSDDNTKIQIFKDGKLQHFRKYK